MPALERKRFEAEGTPGIWPRQIAGYLVVWGEDLEGDVFAPNGLDTSVPVGDITLWQHDQEHPIGHLVSWAQDNFGLFVRAEILDVPGAREYMALVDAGLVYGLSPGFLATSVRPRPDGARGRLIEKFRLIETSIVTVPAQPRAGLTEIKNMALETVDTVETPAPVVPPVPQGRTVTAPVPMPPDYGLLVKRLDALEVKAQRVSLDTPKAPLRTKSWAEVVVESEHVKPIASGKSSRILFRGSRMDDSGCCVVDPIVKGLSRLERKDLVLGATELQGLTQPFYRSQPVVARGRKNAILSLIPSVPIGMADRYIYNRETEASKRGYLSTTLTAATGAGDAFIDVVTTVGCVVGARVRLHHAGGIKDLGPITVVTSATRLTFADAVGAIYANGSRVTLEIYGAVAEKAVKGDSFFALTETTLALQCMPIIMGVTQQRLNGIANFQSFVENLLASRYQDVLAWHVIYGTGTGGMLHGFFSDPALTTVLWSTGTPGESKLDCIFRAVQTVWDNGFDDVTVHLSPSDWRELLTAKGTDNQYLTYMGILRAEWRSDGFLYIGDVRFCKDHALVEGDFLVASHMSASEFVTQDSARFAVGYINDDFVRNQLRCRYEQDCEHAWLDSGAFCKGQFDSAPV